ncbi:MAG: hypothetical protein IKK43_04530 [Clostridia bacterium]|nr:hypothetical protein [Clostridia bacterium]
MKKTLSVLNPIITFVLAIMALKVFTNVQTQTQNFWGFIVAAFALVGSVPAIISNCTDLFKGIGEKLKEAQLKKKPWLKLEKEIEDFVKFLDSEEAEAAVATAALGKVGVAEAFELLCNEVEAFAADVENTAKKTKERARWQRNTATKLAEYQDQYKGLVAVVPPMAP